MKLIVGLGNPGDNYLNTRHNVGFAAIDKFCELKQLALSFNSKFKSLINSIYINQDKIILCKPQTFMNLSGLVVKSISNYYKILMQDIIIIHDDIDIPIGKIKIKQSGSSAGHNGIKNIIQELNSQNFIRIKIGIGRKIPAQELSNYVLSKFSIPEQSLIDHAITQTCEAIKIMLTQNIFFAMNKFNTRDMPK